MRENTRSTLRFFWQHVKPHWGLASLGFLGVSFAVLAAMAGPFLYKYFVDALTLGEPREVLISLLIWIVALDFLSWVMWRVAGYTMSVMEPKGMEAIANHCFDHLHRHSFNFFNNQFVGSLVKRVARMTRSFENVLDQLYFEFYPLFLRAVIVTIALYFVEPVLGWVLLFWTLFFCFIHYRISKYKFKKYDLPIAVSESEIVAALADTVTSHSTVKLFAHLAYEKQRFAQVVRTWTLRFKRAWIFSNHIEAIQGLLMVGLNAFILYYAIRLWEGGELTVGHFFLIQTYLIELFTHAWDFGRYLRHFYEHLADAEEMTLILNTPFEVVDHPKASELQVKKGKVVFEKVSFSYTNDEERSVVKDLSFTVNPGERIALIGPSGGGKTTLIKLLLRFFDLDQGRIFIDGKNIVHVTQDSLRRNIALVPQDPILFHRSLMDNIRYGDLQASEEDVIRVAQLAHCHEFISKLPQGYQTFVGERGVKLSGGERQRVAIARALLANTTILILDEATSSLDSESEKLIKEALKVLMHGKTVFVVAHRLSTIVDMDRILVLERGHIIEEGGHKDLLKKDEGLYKKLWNLQVGGYLD